MVEERKPELKDLGKKVYRDAQQDGLMEVMLGVILMAFGGFFFSVVFVFYIVLIIFAGHIVELVRRRYTYPRLGVVKLPDDNTKEARKGVLIFLLAVFAIIVTLIVFVSNANLTDVAAWLKWFPLLFGMVLIGPLGYAASRSGSLRYYGYTITAVALGIVFSVIEIGTGNTAIILYLTVTGGILLGCGLVIFIAFLHNNPDPSAVEGA